MSKQTPAPVYLNLLRIQFPVGAVTSIGHRISGVCLFLSLPFWIYLLDLSLRGPDGFARAQAILQSPVARLALVLMAWAFLHHLFSGIRFLFMDAGIGRTLAPARRSAWSVNIAALAAALACAGWLL